MENFRRNKRIWCQIWMKEFEEKTFHLTRSHITKTQNFSKQISQNFCFQGLLMAFLRITQTYNQKDFQGLM